MRGIKIKDNLIINLLLFCLKCSAVTNNIICLFLGKTHLRVKH